MWVPLFNYPENYLNIVLGLKCITLIKDGHGRWLKHKMSVMAHCPDKRKARKKEENMVLFTLKPLFFIENCFGMFRCGVREGTIQKPGRGIKVYSGIYVLITTVIYSYFLSSFINSLTGKFYRPQLMDLLEELSMILLHCHHILTFFICLRQSNTNLNILNILVKIDKILAIESNRKFYVKARRRVCLTLVVFFCVAIVLFIFQMIFVVSTRPTEYNIDSIIDFKRFISNWALCIYLKIVCVRLKVINNCLCKIVQKFQETKDLDEAFDFADGRDESYKTGETQSERNITFLLNSYILIGEVCALINKVFNFQIMISLVLTFLYVVIFSLLSLYEFGITHDSISLSPLLCYCTFQIMLIVIMACSCEDLKSTRKKIHESLNEIVIDYSFPKTLREQEKIFVDLTRVWRLDITTYNMFSFNKRIILSLISISITYLNLTIQICTTFEVLNTVYCCLQLLSRLYVFRSSK